MNSAIPQDRQRTTLGSPHASTHPSMSAYSYGPSQGSNMSSGFSVGTGQALNESLAQSRPQYQPGYLLSLASQTMPATGQRHEEPLLIPTRAKMNSTHPRNAPSDFGSDSMFETSSKNRHRETASDEDGPPTSSVVDLVSEIPVDPHRQLSNNSRRPVATLKSSNMPNQQSAALYQTLYVIVFGYPPSRYSPTVAHFRSFAEGGTTETEESTDVENAFKIGYHQPWEAARAWRKNGEVINGDGGRWMIGVKWMDPVLAEQLLGSGAKLFLNSPSASAAETLLSSSQEHIDVYGDPKYSQLQHISTPQQESPPSVGTPIRLAPSTSAFRKATLEPSRKGTVTPVQTYPGSTSPSVKTKGMLGQVSDLVFGW